MYSKYYQKFPDFKQVIDSCIRNANTVHKDELESNMYQKALSGEIIRTTSLPIKQLNTQKDKISRAQRRSALFENGKIRIIADMTGLIDELCLFPDGEHDDTFDALDFALSAIEQSETAIVGDFLGGIESGVSLL